MACLQKKRVELRGAFAIRTRGRESQAPRPDDWLRSQATQAVEVTKPDTTRAFIRQSREGQNAREGCGRGAWACTLESDGQTVIPDGPRSCSGQRRDSRGQCYLMDGKWLKRSSKCTIGIIVNIITCCTAQRADFPLDFPPFRATCRQSQGCPSAVQACVLAGC